MRISGGTSLGCSSKAWLKVGLAVNKAYGMSSGSDRCLKASHWGMKYPQLHSSNKSHAYSKLLSQNGNCLGQPELESKSSNSAQAQKFWARSTSKAAFPIVVG